MRVVPAFDEVEERELSLGMSAERAALDELGLKRREEALAHRVVVAVADGAERRPYARLLAASAEGIRKPAQVGTCVMSATYS